MLKVYEPKTTDLFAVPRLKDPDSNVWYKAKSVCNPLGFKNTTEALKMYCKSNPTKFHVGNGGASFYICRKDVMRLAMKSSSPQAIAFHEWLIEVAETVFDQGAYISPDITPIQAVAAKEKINRILDEAAPWERLYDENRNKGFAWFGYRFYTDYVYSFLTAEEWCKINRLNPVRKEPNGRCDREQRIHQYIEPETKSRLRDTVAVVLGFVDASNTPEEFQELYRRKYGRVAQLELNL